MMTADKSGDLHSAVSNKTKRQIEKTLRRFALPWSSDWFIISPKVDPYLYQQITLKWYYVPLS